MDWLTPSRKVGTGFFEKKGMKAVIERYEHGKKQTLGNLFVQDECDEVVYDCETLELPWKDNQRNISCIPEGAYQVEKRYSKKFGWHFHITDVDGRKWILIHSGNFYTQIRGCVLVGNALGDIDNNGIRDVLNSRDTLADLLGVLPSKFELKIVNC